MRSEQALQDVVTDSVHDPLEDVVEQLVGHDGPRGLAAGALLRLDGARRVGPDREGPVAVPQPGGAVLRPRDGQRALERPRPDERPAEDLRDRKGTEGRAGLSR